MSHKCYKIKSILIIFWTGHLAQVLMLRRTFALSTIHNGVKTFLNSPLNSDTILVLQSHENFLWIRRHITIAKFTEKNRYNWPNLNSKPTPQCWYLCKNLKFGHSYDENKDILAKFKIFSAQLWQQYLHWPSFGGLHSKQSQHSGRHVVVMEHLPSP